MTRLSGSRSWVKDIIIVAIGVAIIWMGLRVVFGTENPFYVVSSGSMIPELQVFDVLVVQGNDPFETVDVGDIIVFDRPKDHDRVIVHRVVSIIDDDPLTMRTKGDANPASIPGTDFPITEEEYIGKVAYVIPQVGYITRILTPPINYIIIAVIIGIMIYKQISKNKKEKELSETFTFESNNENKENIDVKPNLDNLSNDKEYTESEQKTDFKKTLQDDQKNFNPQESNSTNKKPEE